MYLGVLGKFLQGDEKTSSKHYWRTRSTSTLLKLTRNPQIQI